MRVKHLIILLISLLFSCNSEKGQVSNEGTLKLLNGQISYVYKQLDMRNDLKMIMPDRLALIKETKSTFDSLRQISINQTTNQFLPKTIQNLYAKYDKEALNPKQSPIKGFINDTNSNMDIQLRISTLELVFLQVIFNDVLFYTFQIKKCKVKSVKMSDNKYLISLIAFTDSINSIIVDADFNKLTGEAKSLNTINTKISITNGKLLYKTL